MKICLFKKEQLQSYIGKTNMENGMKHGEYKEIIKRKSSKETCIKESNVVQCTLIHAYLKVYQYPISRFEHYIQNTSMLQQLQIIELVKTEAKEEHSIHTAI